MDKETKIRLIIVCPVCTKELGEVDEKGRVVWDRNCEHYVWYQSYEPIDPSLEAKALYSFKFKLWNGSMWYMALLPREVFENK